MKRSNLETALNEYYDFFNENYPLVITSMLSDEEHIAIIKRCIATNRKAEKPKYNDGDDY